MLPSSVAAMHHFASKNIGAGATAAAGPLLDCATQPARPCMGKTSNELLGMTRGAAHATLQNVLSFWGDWKGDWHLHMSNHWSISNFKLCGYAGDVAHDVKGVVFTLVHGAENTQQVLSYLTAWPSTLFAVMRRPLIIFTQHTPTPEFRAQVEGIFAGTGGVTFRPALRAPDRLAHVRPTPMQPSTYAEMCLFLGWDVFQVRSTLRDDLTSDSWRHRTMLIGCACVGEKAAPHLSDTTLLARAIFSLLLSRMLH